MLKLSCDCKQNKNFPSNHNRFCLFEERILAKGEGELMPQWKGEGEVEGEARKKTGVIQKHG